MQTASAPSYSTTQHFAGDNARQRAEAWLERMRTDHPTVWAGDQVCRHVYDTLASLWHSTEGEVWAATITYRGKP
ncbi:MAG: hypothetical protein IT464_12645 [Planctomycetes bacterium]|nr:hypothetical protein [Planctomycetota bacterium]